MKRSPTLTPTRDEQDRERAEYSRLHSRSDRVDKISGHVLFTIEEEGYQATLGEADAVILYEAITEAIEKVQAARTDGSVIYVRAWTRATHRSPALRQRMIADDPEPPAHR